MTATKPRNEFKRLFGQANHFLITALVGLSGIETGVITAAPDALRTSWSPKDKKASAVRTRHFMLGSFLGSAVDSLDVYLTLLYRAPKWIDGPEIEVIYSKAKRSVYRKALDLGEHLSVSPTLLALVGVLITWRNNITHQLAENKLDEGHIEILEKEKESIRLGFCGLEAKDLRAKAESGSDFTFKETAALIRATHDYVAAVDAEVLRRLDVLKFTELFLQDALENNSKISGNYFRKLGPERETYVLNIVQNHLGIQELVRPFISELCSLTRPSARKK